MNIDIEKIFSNPKEEGRKLNVMFYKERVQKNDKTN